MRKLILIGATIMLWATPISIQTPLTLAVDSAEARVGRPLTPVSVAGAHRRYHRRAVYGAAAGAAAYGAYRYAQPYGYGRSGCRCY